MANYWLALDGYTDSFHPIHMVYLIGVLKVFFIVEWVPNRPLNHFRSCHIMSCEIFLYNFLYCHKQLSSRSLKKKRRLKKVDRKPEKQRLFGNLKQESLFENQKTYLHLYCVPI